MKEASDLVQEILNREDCGRIIVDLIKEETKRSVQSAITLIDLIPSIGANLVTNLESQKLKALEAANWAILQQSFNKEDKSARFSSMAPVCKVCFPSGTCERGSYAHKKYFNEFVELLSDRKIFDLSKASDVSWAKNYDYLEYFELVLSKRKEKDNNVLEKKET